MREPQQEAAEPADRCAQRLHRMGDMGLVPGWDQRKVDIAASHEADGIAFEWPREFSELTRSLSCDLKSDEDASRLGIGRRSSDGTSRN
jgi:hypothetical protein